MTGPALDRTYWQGRYDSGTDGWDIGAPSTPLKAYIDQLTNRDLRILIPGCGPAWEGQYLHEQGFTNVWLLDLTGGPYASFLQRCPGFPRDRMLVGDFFGHEGQYDLIIEQTFFCAIDPAMRPAYVSKMHELLAPGGRLAGVLFDDPSPGRDPGGPPFGGVGSEYLPLFLAHFKQVSLERCHNSIEPRQGRELWLHATRTGLL